MKHLNFNRTPNHDLTLATLTNDPDNTILKYININKYLGLKFLDIYIDNPSERPSNILKSSIDGVRLVPCTAEFWKNAILKLRTQAPHIKPDYWHFSNVTGRQEIIYNLSYLKAKTKWFGAIDSDEFFAFDAPIPSFLANLPDPIEQVIGSPWEVIWAPGADYDTAFSGRYIRRNIKNPEKFAKISDTRGALFNSLCKDGGLVGHARGKSILRTGLANILVKTHRGFRVDAAQQVALATHNKRIFLLHFDAISYPAWLNKHGIRTSGDVVFERMGQNRKLLAELFSLSSEKGKLRLFKSLHTAVSQEYVDALADIDGIRSFALGDLDEIITH